MNAPGAVVNAGDTLYFKVNVTDESDINSVSLRFRHSEHTDHVIYVSGYLRSYDEENGIMELALKIPEDKISGTWELYYIHAEDYYGNYNSYIRNYDYTTGEWIYPDIPGFSDISFTIASKEILPTSVNIPEKITVSVCDIYTIRPDVEPITSIPQWRWTSSDTSIAEIYSTDNMRAANVIGNAPGVATITGVTSNGLTVSSEVTVMDAPPPTAGCIDSVYSIDVDTKLIIAPELTPTGATTLYEVTSDNPHVAVVGTTEGHTAVTITGINPGTATITIRGRNNLVMTTTVIVGDESDIQHEKVVVDAVDATCRREGRTSYIKCSACRYHFTEPQTIPVTDHEYDEWYTVTAPTGTRDGVSRRDCKNCIAYETKVIPATGESGQPDNPVIPDNPAKPNTPSSPSTSDSNSKPTINVGSGNVSVNVSGDNVKITVSEKNVSNIIADAAKTGIVGLDISKLDVSGVSVPQNLINAINESSDISALSITTSNGNMEISADALSTIASALESKNDSVKLEINTIDAKDIPATQRYPIADIMNSAAFVNLSATIEHKDNNGKITGTSQIHEFYGDITISVPLKESESMKGRQIIACYFADDGSITYFPAKYENGIVTFKTNHYSAFGVFASSAAAFSDIDWNAWYMTAIEYAAGKELMNGVGNSTFAPDQTLSRAMLAQILYNKAGKPVVKEISQFTDVTASDWFADAVIWAASEGITSGYGNGLFGSNDNVTREQLVVMLWHSVGCPKESEAVLTAYTDSASISSYAQQAMAWALSNGIIGGMGNGVLNPNGNATRAQIAQVLMNFMTKI